MPPNSPESRRSSKHRSSRSRGPDKLTAESLLRSMHKHRILTTVILVAIFVGGAAYFSIKLAE
jgi:hypothetical protein